MQQATQPAKKLYYFSVLFGEAQRVLNLEWDQDLALIYTVTQHAYTQVNPSTQTPLFALFPIEGAVVYELLTQIASDLAAYFEKNEGNREVLCQIMGRAATISYAATGNGSYLYEKGDLKLE